MNDENIIELNVGGVLYATTARTLMSIPASYFVSMLSTVTATSDNSGSDPSDGQQRSKYFIDRDGLLFRYILDYLRNKALLLPDNFSEKRRLLCEAEFYKLADLTHQLRVENIYKDSDALSSSVSSVSSSTSTSTTGLSSSLGQQLAAVAASNAPGAVVKSSKKQLCGCIIVGYRGTFANGRDGLADVKFRKISRILVCGRVQLCRDVFGETLNESRDPDHGVSDRYTSRFFLKHTFLEQAFDSLTDANFTLAAAAATGTNSSTTDKDVHNKSLMSDGEENKWLHYNEFVFIRR